MFKAEWTNKDSLNLQQTCNKLATTDGDLISREGAIECIRWGENVIDVIDRINALPSAEAVQGEWIDRSNGGRVRYPWWENYECNQCGGYGSGAYNYCPNCGAKMSKGGEHYRYCLDLQFGWFGEGDNKAIDMAIEALSAESPKGDLISRQWLLELYGDYIGDDGESKYHVPLEVVRQNIKDAPSSDAVEVVRCKDCKHRDPEDGRCDHGTVFFLTRRTDNDFCSYGERKGGDDE